MLTITVYFFEGYVMSLIQHHIWLVLEKPVSLNGFSCHRQKLDTGIRVSILRPLIYS